jgi:hypothetical protein
VTKLCVRAILAAILLFSIGGVEIAHADLLHRWKADGDALDAVGDDDGEAVGDPEFAASISGQAFEFDGEPDAWLFGADTGNFGTSDFTIAFLIRIEASEFVQAVLAKRTTCGFSSFWDVRTNFNGGLSLEVYETNTNGGVATSVRVDDGLYHTVVFTREGEVVTAYVDGFERGRNEHAPLNDVSNSTRMIAGGGVCVGKDGTVPLTGLLDEIRLADHADPGILPAIFHCGDGNKNGDITATDALSALRTAVGSQACELCLCDINDNGSVTAPDALAILRRSVGQQIPLLCELCPFEHAD